MAAANAHADELRGQLDSLKVKLAGVEAFAGELEVQKMAVAAENQRMADDLDTERSRVAELKVREWAGGRRVSIAAIAVVAWWQMGLSLSLLSVFT